MRYILNKNDVRIIRNSISWKYHIINTSNNKMKLITSNTATKLLELFEVEVEYKTPDDIKEIKRELTRRSSTR